MKTTQNVVAEDPKRPGRDVLGVSMKARGHYIHIVLAQESPLTPKELGEKAEPLARQAGIAVNDRTYTPESTRNHLEFLRKKGLVEQLSDRRWQFTSRGEALISRNADAHVATSQTPHSDIPRQETNDIDIKTVDDKGRLSLPKAFANSKVILEFVSDSELLIRKAIVIAESSMTTIEDVLPPLPNEDRDFFLNLIDNPPEPNDALRKAAKHYKEWHGRNSD